MNFKLTNSFFTNNTNNKLKAKKKVFRKQQNRYLTTNAKGKDKLGWINKHSILPYLSMPQDRAAAILNVSISTLKRKFYTLNMGRWPTIRRSQSEKCQKKRITYLLNKSNVSEKHISSQTMIVLKNVNKNNKRNSGLWNPYSMNYNCNWNMNGSFRMKSFHDDGNGCDKMRF